MESRENPLFGRKVFFISPSFVMEKYLIENLRKNEYEAYILNDLRKVKNVLSAYPDSMCFINIDSEFSYSQWFNFMRSFSASSVLRSIYLGIVCEKADWEDKDKFLMNVRLPGGFNLIHKDEKDLQSFMSILDLNGAKGRRKYLRIDTRNAKDVNGYMTHQGKLYSIDIKDLSSAGFAITYKKDIASFFQKNTLIRNICISAGKKSMVCSCVVFNTQINPDGSAMSVLMLTNENPESTRNYIRDYIFEKFDRQLYSVIENVDNDFSSYSEPDDYSKLQAVRDRDYSEIEMLEEFVEEGDSILENSDSESESQNLSDYDSDIL